MGPLLGEDTTGPSKPQELVQGDMAYCVLCSPSVGGGGSHDSTSAISEPGPQAAPSR